MTDDLNATDPEDESTYDLDLESEDDTAAVMREAVEALEASRRDRPADAADDGEDPSPSDDPPAAAPDRVSELEAELQKAQDRAVRALADYENFRRRVDRERGDLHRYAAEGAVREFLPVLDNLGRAVEADSDSAEFRQGVEMIHRQMQDLLGRLDVVQVESVGERFDPSVHEAVSKEERPDIDTAVVLEEYQTGYRLHDRLLRPAMVRVAVPAEGKAGSGDGEPDA